MKSYRIFSIKSREKISLNSRELTIKMLMFQQIIEEREEKVSGSKKLLRLKKSFRLILLRRDSTARPRRIPQSGS